MDASIGDPRAAPSVERAFEAQPMPGIWEQVTLRSLAISVVLGIVFCFVALRIHMTAGIVPSLTMPTSVLSFYFLKWVITLLRRCGVAALPFTRQETIFLQTSVNSCINTALTGGFATYIIGMTSVVAKSFSDDTDPREIVDHVPTQRWMLFIFLVGLIGILSIQPLKEVMIVDYRLLFPTGTVTAHLINSFHTPQGAFIAKMQVATLLKSFIGSFSWCLFQWFYTSGKDCGFQSFPTFGLELYKRRFYFDFSVTYVGLGMICPHMVNFALLFGAIVSWGFLYPFLQSKRSQWYHTDSPTNLDGLNGYMVFVGITVILTDGIFNFITVITTAAIDFHHKRQEQDSGLTNYLRKHPSLNYDDRKRIDVFLSNQIPFSIPVTGYVTCAIACTVVIPWIFHQIKFYHVAALYMVTPIFVFCNAYGTGLTDWSVAPTYSKFAIFVIAAWVGDADAVVASLVACGIVLAAVHLSAAAMQDLKTGYMTLTSSRAMAAGQIFGVVVGSVVNPCIFLAFQMNARSDVPIGSTQSEFPCPYSGLYRAIGIIGMGGVKELPKHCVAFCLVAFSVTLSMDSLRLVSQRKGWTMQQYVPSMTAVGLPFFLGPSTTIDMCLGSVLLFLWTRIDAQSAEVLSTALAAGMICAEGLFALPAAILGFFNLQPPICMKFIPSGRQVEVVDSFFKSFQKST